MGKLKEWNVYHDFSETSTWKHWKWVERKCQLHVQRHWIWNRIFAPSNFAWRKTIRGRGKSRMSQKVRYLSFRNINMEPRENMQKGSVKVLATCSKSQNLASCTWSVKICVTHECKNICVTRESKTSIWKHMKISRQPFFFPPCVWRRNAVKHTFWDTPSTDNAPLRAKMSSMQVAPPRKDWLVLDAVPCS